MKLPKFWASATGTATSDAGREVPLKCFGWSDGSVNEAKERAAATLARLTSRVREGVGFPEPYSYASRPIREERLEELLGAGGEVHAVVTCNAYGAMVLNTAGILSAERSCQ